MPHTGDWRNGVIAEARRLNDPTMIARVHDRRVGAAPPTAFAASHGESAPIRAGRTSGVLPRAPLALVSSEARNAVVETVKQAEDGQGFVVRLYEAERRRGPVRIRFGVPVSRVCRCELLEVDGALLVVENDGVTLDLSPFEIVSLRVISFG